MHEPFISIIIPTLNRPSLLRRALASIPPDILNLIELIIVNDSSHTPTLNCTPAYLQTNPNTKFINNSGVHGPSGARNFGAINSNGKFLLFLDDDDQFVCDYISNLWNYLRSSSDTQWGFAKILLLSEIVKNPNYKAKGVGQFIHLKDRPQKHHLSGLGYGFWIRRSLFMSIGLLDIELITNEDTEFCVRLLSRKIYPHIYTAYGVIIDDTPKGRLHEQDSITKTSSNQLRAKNFALILQKHHEFLKLNRQLRNHLLMRQLKMLSKSGLNLKDLTIALKTSNPLLIMYFLSNCIMYSLRDWTRKHI